MSEVMEYGLRILLQLALDEMQNVVEAVNDRHDNNSNHLKYTTPYGAINGMITTRENILVQCAMWGIDVSPHRTPADYDVAALRADRDALAARLAVAEQVIAPFVNPYRRMLTVLRGRCPAEIHFSAPAEVFRAACSFLTPTGEGK